MSTIIKLPHGGYDAKFHVNHLLKHIVLSGRDYIIQGQVNCSLKDHPKKKSLDVWLRKNFAQNPNTKQATNEVIDQLVEINLFEVDENLICPESGGKCKGIKLRFF